MHYLELYILVICRAHCNPTLLVLLAVELEHYDCTRLFYDSLSKENCARETNDPISGRVRIAAAWGICMFCMRSKIPRVLLIAQ